jgi:Ca-activated chloride channel homolog
MAIPRLEEEGLRALAAAGGGRYATLTAGSDDLDYLLSGEVAARAAGDEAQATDQWREEGPWLLLLVLPLAALAFRRGWAFVVPLALLPLAQPAEASLWDDLWFNRNQQAERLLEQGEAAAAAQLFEDDEWQAVSRYRAGEYAESAARFAEHEDLRNLYNLGNALARQGELEAAIDAYDEVLEADPGHEDAAHNRDLLEQALEQQRQQQQLDESKESSASKGDESQQSQESQDPNQQSDGQSQSDSEGEDGDSATRPEDESAEQAMRELEEQLKRAAEEAEQQGQQAMSEEELAELRQQQAEQQAMEQWLRRIPNDPGGLLRRKFRYQYQREGRDQDGNPLWPDNEEQPW